MAEPDRRDPHRFQLAENARAHVGDRSVASERRHAAAALGFQYRGPHRRPGQPDVPVRPGGRPVAADHESGRVVVLPHRSRRIEGKGRRPPVSRPDGNRYRQDRASLAVRAAQLREHRRASRSVGDQGDHPQGVNDRAA